MKRTLIWHYTNGLVIDEIVKAGFIKLATAGVDAGEKPAAWFSTNPTWDLSANRGNLLLKKSDFPVGVKFDVNPQEDFEEKPFDPEEMEQVFKGRFRIGVLPEAAPHGWESFKRLSGMKKEIAEVMEQGVEKNGNPREWRASFSPVPRKMWRTIERLVSGVWVTHVELEVPRHVS